LVRFNLFALLSALCSLLSALSLRLQTTFRATRSDTAPSATHGDQAD